MVSNNIKLEQKLNTKELQPQHWASDGSETTIKNDFRQITGACAVIKIKSQIGLMLF